MDNTLVVVIKYDQPLVPSTAEAVATSIAYCEGILSVTAFSAARPEYVVMAPGSAA